MAVGICNLWDKKNRFRHHYKNHRHRWVDRLRNLEDKKHSFRQYIDHRHKLVRMHHNQKDTKNSFLEAYHNFDLRNKESGEEAEAEVEVVEVVEVEVVLPVELDLAKEPGLGSEREPGLVKEMD